MRRWFPLGSVRVNSRISQGWSAMSVTGSRRRELCVPVVGVGDDQVAAGAVGCRVEGVFGEVEVEHALIVVVDEGVAAAWFVLADGEAGRLVEPDGRWHVADGQDRGDVERARWLRSQPMQPGHSLISSWQSSATSRSRSSPQHEHVTVRTSSAGSEPVAEAVTASMPVPHRSAVASPALPPELRRLGEGENAAHRALGLVAPEFEVLAIAEQVGVGAELAAQVVARTGREPQHQ